MALLIVKYRRLARCRSTNRLGKVYLYLVVSDTLQAGRRTCMVVAYLYLR